MKKNLYLLFLVMAIVSLHSTPLPGQKRPLPHKWAVSHIIAPADGAVVSANALKVLVSFVPGANRYTLELSIHPEFLGDVKRFTSKGITFTVSDLETGARYYARVKTNRSGYGRTTSFTTELMSDVTVAIKGGVSGSVDYSLVAMRIEPAGKSSYSIAVSSSPNFKKETVLYTSLYHGQNEFIIKNLREGRKYFARASGDDGVWGPVVPFTTSKKAKLQRLWGVTTTGGTNNQGTIFSFDPESGRFQKHLDYQHEIEWVYLSGSLVRTPEGLTGLSTIDATGGGEVFTVKPDGTMHMLETYGPHNGSVMLGSDNYLYLVDDWINVFQGGIYKMYSAGDDVFPPDRIIHSFEGEEHGLNPVSQLLQVGRHLFGNAPYGGTSGKGTVFRGSMDGSDFVVVHHFNGPDGESPSGPLVAGEDGFLYGVTELGGSGNYGVVYRVREDGTDFKTIFSFSGTNGKSPKGSLLWYNGRVYGTTKAGGSFDQGVVYSLRSDGSDYRVLHQFSGSDGGAPLGGLTVQANKLFGMTSRGGTHELGVIFEIRPDGSGFSTRFDFSVETGGAPDGTLTLVDELEGQKGSTESSTTTQNVVFAEVSVYPNPFRDSFRAVFDSESRQSLEFLVSDMNGNVLIRQSGEANIPMELGDNLQKGLYVLKIRDGDNVITRKLIKQ